LPEIALRPVERHEPLLMPEGVIRGRYHVGWFDGFRSSLSRAPTGNQAFSPRPDYFAQSWGFLADANSRGSALRDRFVPSEKRTTTVAPAHLPHAFDDS
jgi:hypothetical protein